MSETVTGVTSAGTKVTGPADVIARFATVPTPEPPPVEPTPVVKRSAKKRAKRT